MTYVAIKDLRITALPQYSGGRSALVVVEGEINVPFRIARVFTISAPKGAVRGRHAHRACAQFMIAISGAIEVGCDDGRAKAAFTLDRGDCGLLVPPYIWASEEFRAPGSILLVLCDRPFEADDYIRDYDAFRAARGAGGGGR